MWLRGFVRDFFFFSVFAALREIIIPRSPHTLPPPLTQQRLHSPHPLPVTYVTLRPDGARYRLNSTRSSGPKPQRQTKDQHQRTPVEPKPPCPREVSSSAVTTEKPACTTGATTHCAIRSPCCTT